MYWRKTYWCRDTIFVEKTQSRYHRKGEERAGKSKPTPEEKKAANTRAAVRKLNRLITANFGEDDYFITLTYGRNGPPSPDEAKEKLRELFTKLRKEYRKLNAELKYIAVTEYANKRIHHHVIVNGLPETPKLLKKLWENGRPDMKMLDGDGDYEALADYLVKETAKSETAYSQKYTRSRNLEDPQPKKERVSAASFRKEPKPVKGYELLKKSLVQGENSCGYRYQYYTMVRKRNCKATDNTNRQAVKDRRKDGKTKDGYVCQGHAKHGNDRKKRHHGKNDDGEHSPD